MLNVRRNQLIGPKVDKIENLIIRFDDYELGIENKIYNVFVSALLNIRCEFDTANFVYVVRNVHVYLFALYEICFFFQIVAKFSEFKNIH